MFIIFILCIVGTWKLFFSKEDITTKIEFNQNQQPVTEQKTEEIYESTLIEEYQYNIKPKQNPPLIEENTIEYTPSYPTVIEQNENDITITLNSPETAIESNNSTIFAENEVNRVIETESTVDNDINMVENITKSTAPTDKPSEHVVPTKNTNKEKTVKTNLKRNIIIHKIVKGDTLWAIAKRYVNNPYRYRELAKLSKIKNPNRIYPGNKVRIIIYTK